MKYLILLVIILSISSNSYTQNDVIVSIANIQVATGDEFSFPIHIDPNSNTVAAISLSLYFDPSILESIEFTPISGWSIASNLNLPGQVKISGFTSNGESNPFDIGTVQFNVIGDMNTSSPLSLNITALGDNNANSLNYQIQNANINLDISEDGDCNTEDGPLDGIFNADYIFKVPAFLSSPNTGNKTQITASAHVEMTAGHYIDLKPGFTAEYGSLAIFKIEECDIQSQLKTENEHANLRTENTASNNNNLDNFSQKTDPIISVYPNPISGFGQIEYVLSSDDIISLTVSDTQGKFVYTGNSNIKKKAGRHTIRINSQDLKAGTYVVQLTSTKGIFTSKFIIVN